MAKINKKANVQHRPRQQKAQTDCGYGKKIYFTDFECIILWTENKLQKANGAIKMSIFIEMLPLK